MSGPRKVGMMFGKGHAEVELAEGVDVTVVEKQAMAVIGDASGAIEAALNEPASDEGLAPCAPLGSRIGNPLGAGNPVIALFHAGNPALVPNKEQLRGRSHFPGP